MDAHLGTNCQEIIRVLIDRVKYLNGQIPCEENDDILDHLRESLWLFEFRAAARHDIDKLEVKGGTENIEHAPACEICGHLTCSHKSTDNNDKVTG